jgi:A/G-specific adenine glycosylase
MSTQSVPPERLSHRDRRSLEVAILGWYDARGRSLPFRGTRDPYAILVSEVMAQQTQIARVGPAWGAFVARFPSFEALAAAAPADVLRAWRGLGYDRRALNLQRTARIVVADHGGRLPADLASLEGLPGIGPYTARAVAAIAFEAPVGAVDTNVRRVLGRVIAGDPRALAPREMQALADACVPRGRAADWTHAVMDVGAMFCRTTHPACEECPAKTLCRYAADGRGVGAIGPAQWAQPAASGRASGRALIGRSAATPRRPRPVPFQQTTRWLRGRILDRARSAEGASWTRYDDPIGAHPHGAVVAMLGVLGREGMLELAPTDRSLARLPHEPLVTSSRRGGQS